MSILDWPLVARTRRNHGLEHATVHVLGERHPGLGIIGRSTPNCFYIYGDLTAEPVQTAVAEALAQRIGRELPEGKRLAARPHVLESPV